MCVCVCHINTENLEPRTQPSIGAKRRQIDLEILIEFVKARCPNLAFTMKSTNRADSVQTLREVGVYLVGDGDGGGDGDGDGN